MLRRAVALDPDRVISRFTLAWVLLGARRQGGLVHLDTAIAADPAALALRGMRAWTRIFYGDTAGARADIRMEHRDDIRVSGSASAALARLAGDTAGARALAGQLASDFPAAPTRVPWGASWVALAYAQAGDAKSALDILERIEPQGLQAWWMTQFMGFDPIRRDPEFQRFVAELAPQRP
jgi:cytochrome c551/c552